MILYNNVKAQKQSNNIYCYNETSIHANAEFDENTKFGNSGTQVIQESIHATAEETTRCHCKLLSTPSVQAVVCFV